MRPPIKPWVFVKMRVMIKVYVAAAFTEAVEHKKEKCLLQIMEKSLSNIDSFENEFKGRSTRKKIQIFWIDIMACPCGMLSRGYSNAETS